MEKLRLNIKQLANAEVRGVYTHELRELNSEEIEIINGGETFWYWAGYAFAQGVKFLESLENTPKLPSADQYK